MIRQVRTELVQKAVDAKQKAYAPYSKFRVGSAVLTEEGEIFSGSNVENASYGLAICGERNAIFHAVHAGKKKIKAVAVATDEQTFISPCGACRQVIAEFADAKTEILMVNAKGKVKTISFGKLFPAGPMLDKLKKK